jgi:hypothetical protein
MVEPPKVSGLEVQHGGPGDAREGSCERLSDDPRGGGWFACPADPVGHLDRSAILNEKCWDAPARWSSVAEPLGMGIAGGQEAPSRCGSGRGHPVRVEPHRGTGEGSNPVTSQSQRECLSCCIPRDSANGPRKARKQCRYTWPGAKRQSYTMVAAATTDGWEIPLFTEVQGQSAPPGSALILDPQHDCRTPLKKRQAGSTPKDLTGGWESSKTWGTESRGGDEELQQRPRL